MTAKKLSIRTSRSSRLHVPDEWPTWPFTKLDPRVVPLLEAKLAARRLESENVQRQAIRAAIAAKKR